MTIDPANPEALRMRRFYVRPLSAGMRSAAALQTP